VRLNIIRAFAAVAVRPWPLGNVRQHAD